MTRTGSRDGQSKFSQENSKQTNNGDRHGMNEGIFVFSRHIHIVESFFDSSELNIESYQDVLQKRDREDRNLIHQTILELKRKRKRAPLKALNLVEVLVLDEPKLFTQKDVDGKVPLLGAAEFNVEILFRVIDLVIPDSVLESIKIKCDKSHQSCPLRDVHERRREQCRKKPKPASPDDSQQREQIDRSETPKATQTETGDAKVEDLCLHDLIDIDQVVKKDAQLREILSEALDPEKKAQLPCLQSLIVYSNFDPGQNEGIPIIPLDSFKLLLQFCPDTVFESATQNGYSPLQMAIRLYDKQSIDYDHLFSVIQALVYRSPSSIYFKAGYEAQEDRGKTAYRPLKELKEVKPESYARSQSRKYTEELLKRTCIGSPQKNWDAKIEFLYWNAKSGRSKPLLCKTQVRCVCLT
jgi:hypothetical protein